MTRPHIAVHTAKEVAGDRGNGVAVTPGGRRPAQRLHRFAGQHVDAQQPTRQGLRRPPSFPAVMRKGRVRDPRIGEERGRDVSGLLQRLAHRRHSGPNEIACEVEGTGAGMVDQPRRGGTDQGFITAEFDRVA